MYDLEYICCWTYEEHRVFLAHKELRFLKNNRTSQWTLKIPRKKYLVVRKTSNRSKFPTGTQNLKSAQTEPKTSLPNGNGTLIPPVTHHNYFHLASYFKSTPSTKKYTVACTMTNIANSATSTRMSKLNIVCYIFPKRVHVAASVTKRQERFRVHEKVAARQREPRTVEKRKNERTTERKEAKARRKTDPGPYSNPRGVPVPWRTFLQDPGTPNASLYQPPLSSFFTEGVPGLYTWPRLVKGLPQLKLWTVKTKPSRLRRRRFSSLWEGQR